MEIDIQTKTTSSLSYLIGKKGYFTEQNSWTGLSSEIRNINLVDAGWTLLTPVNSGKYYISSHNGLIYFFNGEVFKLNNGVLESISSGLNPNAKYSAYKDEFYYCGSTSKYVGDIYTTTPIFIRYSNNGSGNYNYSQITDGSTNFANAAIFGNATWSEQRHSTYTSCRWQLKIGGSTAEGPYFVATIYYGDFGSSSGSYYNTSGTRVLYSSNGSSWSGNTFYTFANTTSSSDYTRYPSGFYCSSANGKYICTGSNTIERTTSYGFSYFTNPASITKTTNENLIRYYDFDTNDCIKYNGNIYYGSVTPTFYYKVAKSTDGFTYTFTTNDYIGGRVSRKIDYYNGTYYCMLADSLYSSTNLESYTQLLVPANIKSWVGIYDSKIYVVTNDGLFYKPVSELQPNS